MRTPILITATTIILASFVSESAGQGILCSSRAYLGFFDPISNEARSVSVSGDVAAVADGGMIRLVDVSDVSSPVELGFSLDATYPYDVHLDGTVLYVAAFWQGLLVLDVADPASPVLIGQYDTPGTSRGLDVVGGLAFIADGSPGNLQIVDVSTPTNPSLVGSLDLWSIAKEVTVDGDRAAVALHSGGVAFVDISDPSTPELLGSYFEYPMQVSEVALQGDLAYVAAGDPGLHVVDVSDPTNPAQVGSYQTLKPAATVTALDDRVVVGDGATYVPGGVRVLDVSVPTDPVLVGTYALPDQVRRVVVRDEVVYAASNTAGLRLLDVSTPTGNPHLGLFDTPNVGAGVVVHPVANVAYVADGQGLQVFDVTEPSSPVFVDSLSFTVPGPLPSTVLEVVLEGNVLYAIDTHLSGIHVVDVSDPFAPVLAVDYALTGTGRDVSVVGDVAAMLSGADLVTLADVTTPASPVVLGQFTALSPHIACDYEGSMLYLAGTEGLAIYDVSNPGAVVLVGEYVSPFPLIDVDVSGGYAYLAGGTDGLVVVDVSEPSDPTLTEVVDLGGWAQADNVEVSGDVVYVAGWTGGLLVVDIADPNQPTFALNYQVVGPARDVHVVGETAYVAVGELGVQIIDLSDCATSIAFVRGDANADGSFDISDPIVTLDSLFAGAPVLCTLALDSNSDGSMNLADAVFSLAALFSMGAFPGFPFPDCGVVSAPGLSCDAFAACP